MSDPKENNPKIPLEPHESSKQVLPGGPWVKDMPNILSAESFTKIEWALKKGVVFGHHHHYYGGRSLDNWAFLDFNQLKEYLSHSRPGDAYDAWSVKYLDEKKLVLAHGRSSSSRRENSLLISTAELQRVRQYLGVQYNEIINIHISWDTRTVTIDYGDIDSYEDLENDVQFHSHPNSEIYIFPLTDIQKQEHYLLTAKYPNDKGEVPIGGAY